MNGDDAPGGDAPGDDASVPGAAIDTDLLANVSSELQGVLRKHFVDFIKTAMVSSYYIVLLHKGAMRQLANTLRPYRMLPGEEDAMIRDVG